MLLLILIICIIFVLFLISRVTENFNNNSRIKNTNYIFIHIPKNAGTSFSEKYCVGQPGHKNANDYSIEELINSVAIVRNPYDRIISCYKYFKMKNNYWSKKYNASGNHTTLHDYCTKNSFKQFISDLYDKKIEKDIHLKPQSSFLKKDNKIYTKIMKLENLNEDFYKIFNKKLDIPKLNKSDNYNIYIDQETKNKIYEMYKEDFELFGYPKNKL
mgnify:CR=1 FL=1